MALGWATSNRFDNTGATIIVGKVSSGAVLALAIGAGVKGGTGYFQHILAVLGRLVMTGGAFKGS